MVKKIISTANPIRLKNFFIPTRYEKSAFRFEDARVCALIPTYKPEELTYTLVESLLEWNPYISVYVVDDCTPKSSLESLGILEKLKHISNRVMVLRTPVNKMKAGALNFGLVHLLGKDEGELPHVVLTLDDDIVITSTTVRNLVTELMSYDHLGAVCSQCNVLNKNKNLLTRLQGLEYLGFNATRLADEGFLQGPLVMHGMLTAFRTTALQEIGGFAEGHLIEDYEITARLKAHGWSVKSAMNAHAWTKVPETFSKLWRQRTRWSYGGITVVDRATSLPSVLQDLIGHVTFWATLCMIDMLIFSILFKGSGHVSREITYLIIGASVLQVIIWYFFQLWLMRFYKEKDVYDWLIRLIVVPEFIYANVLTLGLVGSYAFLFFNTLASSVSAKSSPFLIRFVGQCTHFFAAFGYNKSNWGTRVH